MFLALPAYTFQARCRQHEHISEGKGLLPGGVYPFVCVEAWLRGRMRGPHSPR